MQAPAPSSQLVTDFARSVLRQNLKVQRGEHVIIEGWTHTLPWAVALARETRRMGALPLVVYEDEQSYWDAAEHGSDRVLGTRAEHEWAALGKTDVYIHMWGPGDRVRIHAQPETRQERLFEFNEKWYKAAEKAGLRGARLEVGRPYPSLARAYGVDEEAWRQQVIAATMVDPQRMKKAAAPVARALEKGKRLTLRDDHGTDLTLGLAHRKARVFWGQVDAAAMATPYQMLMNLPAGLVRVALDEKVADGTLVSDRTCYYDDGKATGARFQFRNGRLVEATFDSGGERFDEPFQKAGKGRDQPGLFSLGLNPALHDTPQVEDLERGAALVSVGGNRQFGGRNKAQFFGWAVTAGATVEVDGRPLTVAA